MRFEVEDTGPGISTDLQSRLFHEFEQGDGSLTRRHGGMGLGLAIVAGLAHLMRGQAGVDSQLGRGSTFWLEVPLISLDAALHNDANANGTLAELLELLKNDDLRARQVFANLSPEARRTLGSAHMTLATQMAHFDFAGALQTLNDGVLQSQQPDLMPE